MTDTTLIQTDDYSILNLVHWLNAKYRRHGELEDSAAADALEQQAAQIEALRADAERLRALATCGCGDGFTAHDPGTCGNCMAAIDAALRQEQPAGEGET